MAHLEVPNMNLSPLFQRASETPMPWSLDSAEGLLQKICGSLNESVIDWEKGDEEWGRVLQHKRVVSLVCARIPLVIVASDLKEVVEKLVDANFLIFCVDDMAAKSWLVDKKLLERIFSKALTDNINYAELSIDDLWWCTV